MTQDGGSPCTVPGQVTHAYRGILYPRVQIPSPITVSPGAQLVHRLCVDNECRIIRTEYMTFCIKCIFSACMVGRQSMHPGIPLYGHLEGP